MFDSLHMRICIGYNYPDMNKTPLFLLLFPLAAVQSCTTRESVAGPAINTRSATGSAGSASSASASPSGQALKTESFKCDISLSAPPTTLKTTDGAAKFRVKITNESNETWKRQIVGNDPFFKVNVGYHWIEEKSQKSAMEGGRAWFSRDLLPGESEDLEISVSPPKEPGSYLLRIEPVQEAVAWFSSNHGCKQDYRVTVEP